MARSAVQVELCQATGNIECQVCAASLCIAAVLAIERVLFVAAPIGIEPALDNAGLRGGFLRQKPVVPDQHHFDVLEPHVGAIPVSSPSSPTTCKTFRRAGRFANVVVGRKMRLTEERRIIAGIAASVAGHALGSPISGFEVDAVVVHTVGTWQHPGQDRRPCRLTDDARCDAGGKPRALGREPVEVRRLDPPPLESETVGALLVGGDEQEVGSGHGGISGLPRENQETTSAAMAVRR